MVAPPSPLLAWSTSVDETAAMADASSATEEMVEVAAAMRAALSPLALLSMLLPLPRLRVLSIGLMATGSDSGSLTALMVAMGTAVQVRVSLAASHVASRVWPPTGDT